MTDDRNSLFDQEGAIFMGARREPEGCQVGVFGVPYDGTIVPPGTRFGPAAVREVSTGLETYCPQLDRDLEALAYADLGAVEIPFGAPEPVVDAVKKATACVLSQGLKPLMLGGEHLDYVRSCRCCRRPSHRSSDGAAGCPRRPAR